MDGDTQNLAPKRQPRWRKAFLAALAECGIVTKACQAARTNRNDLYTLRREDPTFAREWDDALQAAADQLEEEARRRAHDGLVKYKFDKGQPVLDPRTGQPYYELEYSDTLLIFLLKGSRPEKFRERYEVTGKDGGSLKMEAKVEHDVHDDLLPYADAIRRLAAGALGLPAAGRLPSDDPPQSLDTSEAPSETGGVPAEPLP